MRYLLTYFLEISIVFYSYEAWLFSISIEIPTKESSTAGFLKNEIQYNVE